MGGERFRRGVAFLHDHLIAPGTPKTTLVYPHSKHIKEGILRDRKLCQVRPEKKGPTLQEELIGVARDAREKSLVHGASEGWAFLITDLPSGYSPQDRLKKLINPRIHGFPDNGSNAGGLFIPAFNLAGTAFSYLEEIQKMVGRASLGKRVRWKVAAVAFCSEEDLPNHTDLARIADGCPMENPLIFTVKPKDRIDKSGKIIKYDDRIIVTNLFGLSLIHALESHRSGEPPLG